MEFKPEVGQGQGRLAAKFNVNRLKNGIKLFVLYYFVLLRVLRGEKIGRDYFSVW